MRRLAARSSDDDELFATNQESEPTHRSNDPRGAYGIPVALGDAVSLTDGIAMMTALGPTAAVLVGYRRRCGYQMTFNAIHPTTSSTRRTRDRFKFAK